ncbi:MAG: YgjV family protein [Rhodospirillales bacterium]|nr:YgjV family protein [Rhodospirillales bacterium]MCB9995276.1 YgjV family protein [Rhodospirillales bacterium]
MIFEWVHIVFLAGFVGGLAQFHLNSRRHMMALRVFNCLMFVLYFLLLGKMTAAAACSIAMLGSLMQAAFRDDLLQKTMWLRTGTAVLLAAAGCYLFAGSAGEMLPLFAVAGARMIECFSSPQNIRMGLLSTQLCWLTYHWQQGLIMPFCAEAIFILSNLTSIWRYEQARKREMLVPVYAPLPSGRRLQRLNEP